MESTFCPKCSTQLIINDNLRQSNFIKCPNCKISFENPYFINRTPPNNHDASNRPKASVDTWIIRFFVIVFFTGTLITYLTTDSKEQPIIENSSYDNSVAQVETYLRHHLKDPDSYEPISWSKVSKVNDNLYKVLHKYRAKNSYGAYTIEQIMFSLDAQGNVIETFVEYGDY